MPGWIVYAHAHRRRSYPDYSRCAAATADRRSFHLPRRWAACWPMISSPTPLSRLSRSRPWMASLVRSTDTLEATPDRPITLHILGTLGAGHQASWTLSPGTAVRIMTGAPIPHGADAVVKREDTEFDADSVRILRPVPPNDHIIPPGRDIPEGATLLRAGEVITASGIGVCCLARENPGQRLPAPACGYPRPRRRARPAAPAAGPGANLRQ